METLGHAQIATTMHLYSRVIHGTQRRSGGSHGRGAAEKLIPVVCSQNR